ncbi:MAG: hypothetical protein R6U67_15235, partial [Sodalinema sp.]
MVRLKAWQWTMLAIPLVGIVGFILVAAGWQIQHWGLSWIWAIFLVILLGWRWLLAKWTKPQLAQIEAVVADANQQLVDSRDEAEEHGNNPEAAQAVREALNEILQETHHDPPFWDDWEQFWQRGQAVVVAVAHAYNPEVKYPLLNIYVPQAYGLIRGTVDDLDRWIEEPLRPTPDLTQFAGRGFYFLINLVGLIGLAHGHLSQYWREFLHPAIEIIHCPA